MRMIKIGIDATTFEGWGGGIDFIAMISEALEDTGKVQTYLVFDEVSPAAAFVEKVRSFLRVKGNFSEYRKQENNRKKNRERLLQTFSVCSPNTIPLVYKKSLDRLLCRKDIRELKKLNYLQQCGVEVFLPSANCSCVDTPIPRIGYIFDFQHKYLMSLFDEHECQVRDKNFGRILQNAKHVIVNAEDVKKDIHKYYPESKSNVVVLPFKPFQRPLIKEKTDLAQYNLPEKYYIICNQFWMHKSHITAFKALEILYNEGITDIHIVCTGEMSDSRNPQYIANLKNSIECMNCRGNIHTLGFIPKDDQIQIMKNAIALIQPTLFEGGPGGGSVYNALCLGVPCLVSDIPVNKEINGYDCVYFFEQKNEHELAALMKAHCNDAHIDDVMVDNWVARNRKEYGEKLLEKLSCIINQETNKSEM